MNTSSSTLEKMILQATLQANLNTLKVYVPDIYNDFKNYTPKNTWVIIDENGTPNLFNNNKCVYEDGAKEFCREQVAEYIETPAVYALDIPSEPEGGAWEHTRILSKINEKRKSENPISPPHDMNEDRLDLFLMLGAGLGFQIEELFQKKRIQNLILCEPSRDVFYAMLHCVELKPIIESCISLGGTVSMTVGGTALDPINAINRFFQNHGPSYIGRIYTFKHYNSATNDETIKQLEQLGYRLLFGWGFMEDEMVGLEHTLANIQSGCKICKTKTKFINKGSHRQVFIAANGPSIDYCMDFLRENQDKLIIISCGTTLKALLKNNIKPDIHVEMERITYLADLIEAIEEQQEDSAIKLKDIQLVALNTVQPEVLEKFKSPLILTKNVDVGGVFIKSIDKLNLYAVARYPNPTCVNTAMGLVTLLDFKEVYLLGTDFGYASKEKHHSKDSLYYEESYDSKEAYDAQMTDDLSRKGNFRELVSTTTVYDSTRINLEFLLSLNPDVKVYNTADGAYIQLTEPKRLESIKLSVVDGCKQEFLKKLLHDAFSNQQLKMGNIDKKLKDNFYLLRATLEQLILIMDKKVNSRETLADIFAEQYRLLKMLENREEYKFNYWLIQGTFRYFQSVIMANSYFYKDLERRNDFMNFCLIEFKEHLLSLYQKLINTYADV